MYLLDTNVFIQAKNDYYKPEIFLCFWEWLDVEQNKGHIGSIKPIYEELIKGKNGLADWAKKRRSSGWFLPADDEHTQENLKKIVAVVSNSSYSEPARSDFLSKGDPWLIAKSMTIGAKVVTQETFNESTTKKIKIPND